MTAERSISIKKETEKPDNSQVFNYMDTNSQFIEVQDFGQIGAGKVVDFIPKNKKRWIVVPQTTHRFQHFITYTVSGNSLVGRGIFDGDVLICRTRFEVSEIKEDTVCVLLIHNAELTVKMIEFNEDGTVTIKSAHPGFPDRRLSSEEVYIKALVSELQRKV